VPKRRRRSFTAEFKAQVVLEFLSGLRSQAEVARQLECPTCGAALKVKPEHEGRRFRCPACSGAVTVPAGAAEPLAETVPATTAGAAGAQAAAGAGATRPRWMGYAAAAVTAATVGLGAWFLGGRMAATPAHATAAPRPAAQPGDKFDAMMLEQANATCRRLAKENPIGHGEWPRGYSETLELRVL
jgi:hypothetical protein